MDISSTQNTANQTKCILTLVFIIILFCMCLLLQLNVFCAGRQFGRFSEQSLKQVQTSWKRKHHWVLNWIIIWPTSLEKRISSGLCKEVGSNHTTVVLMSSLSHWMVLFRVFELWDEICSSIFFMKLTHLIEYAVAGHKYTPPTIITLFIIKLVMCLQWVKDVDSFESLKAFLEENKLQNMVIPLMKEHISGLQKLQRYFQKQERYFQRILLDPWPPHFIDVTSDSSIRIGLEWKNTLLLHPTYVKSSYSLFRIRVGISKNCKLDLRKSATISRPTPRKDVII